MDKWRPVEKKAQTPLKLTIANFNVCNHLHLNKFTKFKESEEASINRYIYSIMTLINHVNYNKISAVSLSEVTPEYYGAFLSLLDVSIQLGFVKVFYSRKSLMTVFFDQPNLIVQDVKEIDLEYDPERDRLQVFNLMLKKGNKTHRLTYINIHGYGLPEIREKYLQNTMIFIDELRLNKIIENDFLCVGDFNSEWDQVNIVLENIKNQNYLLDLSLHKDWRATSYHRYILDEKGQFTEKPKSLWYAKMDHLLFTGSFKVENLIIVPYDFTSSEHPYKIVKGFQVPSQWPSDHTLNIYNLSWSGVS